MRVISRSRLRAYWESAGGRTAEGSLRAWFTHVSSRSVDWKNWSDVKRTFASASLVGNCVVFNIGGNKFRLVCRVSYVLHRVYILKVMSHAEYDRGTWTSECGCYSEPPAKN